MAANEGDAEMESSAVATTQEDEGVEGPVEFLFERASKEDIRENFLRLKPMIESNSNNLVLKNIWD